MSMFNKLIRDIACITLLCLSAPTFAASCDDDTLESNTGDGKYLVMQSGEVYEVLDGDSIDSSLWLTSEDVVICERPVAYGGRNYLLYDIINKDENEKVSALRRK